MSAVAAVTVARWRRDLDEHRQVDGRCPVCRTRRRCWPRAEAFGQLLAHGLLESPATDDRPYSMAG